ncbi:MAG: GldG family protein [Planctomycetota bacterium]|jgi:ABC-2 type transport system permease protein
MSNKRSTFLSYLLGKVFLQTALVLGIVIFLGLILSDAVLRWDLTEDNRFTISDASHRMAARLPDRLTIRAYFTQEPPERVMPFYRQTIDILEEYEAASGGKIKIEQYDPSENSRVKTEAEGYGIQPADLMIFEATARKRVQVWGSIVLLYGDRKSEVINIASRYGQGYEGLSGLEYELSSRIWQLANEKPTLGITGHLSSVPPGGNPMNPTANRPRPMFQGVRRVLGDAFDIQDVDLNQVEPDPAKIPCLMVVRPKEFNDVQKFRLDQFLMKGGRVIMFVTQGEIAPNPMGQGMRLATFKTGLEEWLDFHGVRVPAEIVMHMSTNWAQPRRARTELGIQPVLFPVPAFPIVTRESMEGCLDEENPAIQPLRDARFLWPHPVDVLEAKIGKEVKATVLVRSDEKQSWRWRDMNRIGIEEVVNGIRGGDDMPTKFYSSPMVVALEGTFDSYYSKNPIPPSLSSEGTDAPGEEEEKDPEDGKGEEKKSKLPDVVKRSKSTHLVIVGNAIFVSDMLLGGNAPSDVTRSASAVAFNLVDWLARSSELIALRAKTYTNRDLNDPIQEEWDELEAEFNEGKITAGVFSERLTQAQDAQKEERKFWRRLNMFAPPLLVLLLGLVVWVARLARRATASGVPEAVAPAEREIG